MRYVACLAILLAACGGEPAPVEAPPIEVLEGEHLWNVDASASTLTFRGVQEGEAFEGRFEDFDVQVDLDPDELSDAAILVTVDMTSVVTGDRDRDGALPGKDWFAVGEFPTASFRSDSIDRVADTYMAEGFLKMKGVTAPALIEFTLDVDGDTAIARGSARLDRQDWNVGSGAFATDEWIAYPVSVAFTLQASR